MKRIASFAFLLCIWISDSFGQAKNQLPFELPPRQELLRIETAVIQTEKGDLTFRLFPERAPWHVANFKYVADKGLYRKAEFNFFQFGTLLQGGKPLGGFWKLGYQVPPEFSSLPHKKGSLGMARVEDRKNPERVSSAYQFYITLREVPSMNGNYSLFGQLTQGYDVLEKLRQGDLITNIQVYLSP